MRNRINKFLVIVNAVILLTIFYNPAVIKAQTATAPSGSGTSSDPYQIATLNNLYWLSQTTSAWAAGIYFIQTADIDASSTSGWDSGAGFSPIGNSTTFFQGNYNGNGHTIDGLYINRSSTARLGLFGTIAYTSVYDLGLTNVNITGGTGLVGGLVAVNRNSTITRCFTTGTINSNGLKIGGIIGYNNSGCTVSNCYSSISISGSGSTYVGGLVGDNYTSATVSNSYAIGAVTSSASYVGGFSGRNIGTITGGIWDTDIVTTGIGTGTTTGATGRTTAQMKIESNFTTAGWDFKGETTNGSQDIWGINSIDNSGYPFLSWQGYTVAIMPSGSGTSGDPYLIATFNNLYWLSQQDASIWNNGKYFKQTADIDASPSSGWSKGFKPLGDGTYFNCFYDGDGHTIDGLYINRPSITYIGFISSVDHGGVKNLGVTNVDITGGNGVGAIAGSNTNGNIENCFSTGVVKGDTAVGGILGYCDGGWNTNIPGAFDVTGCYSSAGVSANMQAGGLIGRAWGNIYYNTAMKITNCYSNGIVSCRFQTGGIVGFFADGIMSNVYSTAILYAGIDAGGIAGVFQGNMSNCYYHGLISTTYGTTDGGLVGEHDGGTIDNCYAAARNNVPEGTDLVYYEIGGLVGANSGGTTTNSFWDADYSGLNYSAEGTPKTYSQMTTSSTFLDAGWDPSIWYRDDSYNDGYPYLAWQNPSGTPLPVELTSFTAVLNENKVELNWKTATEVNNYGFEIERSAVSSKQSASTPAENAESWENIGFVKGSGTSTSPITYSFVDDNPLQGSKTEYRLKQENYDGTFKYSSIISVNMLPVKFVLSQNYPNPFNPTTTIKYAIPKAEHVIIKVYDELGNEVRTLFNGNKKAGHYSIQFNGSGLASGVYYYRINAGKFSEVKKLMLLK